MSRSTTNDPHALLLGALAQTLTDERRARRFLDMTGLDAAALRATVGEPRTLIALLDFLEAHEPDLVAVAGDLGVAPETLVAARSGLGG